MCPRWDAALECFVRGPSSAPNMRKPREQDHGLVQGVSPRLVPGGLVSWEHFQHPEPLQPPRGGVFPQPTSARTLGLEARYKQDGDTPGSLTSSNAEPIAGLTRPLLIQYLHVWTPSTSAPSASCVIGIGLRRMRARHRGQC